MQPFTLYYETKEIKILNQNSLYNITKVCCSNSSSSTASPLTDPPVITKRLFLLNTHHELYTGQLSIVEEDDLADDELHSVCSVELKLLKSEIVDIACLNDELFVVEQGGCVYRLDDAANIDANEWTEIVVPNPKKCPHGYRSMTEKVQISKINCNNDGILFTTIQGQLFAMGDFGDVVRSAEVPVPVECFSGCKILQVTTGEHFAVVLTYKKPHTGHAEDDYSEEVSWDSNSVAPFLNTECLKCAPDSFSNQFNGCGTTDTSSGSQSDIFELDAAGTTHESVKDLNIDLDKKGEHLCVNEEGVSSRRQSGRTDSALDLAIDLHFEQDVDNKIVKMCRMGAKHLATGVWCFGSVNKGRLGTGDHIKRTRISPILALTGQGVVKISSGQDHSIALTLDGRLFLWGNNGHQQVSTEEIEDVSSPRRYRNAQQTLAADCGKYLTAILLNDFTIKELRRKMVVNEKQFKMLAVASDEEAASDAEYPYFVCGDNVLVQNYGRFNRIEKHLSAEQKFLQDSLTTYTGIIKPFLKKLHFYNKNQMFDQLCQQYLNIVNLTAVNCRTMFEYFTARIQRTDIVVLANSVELIAAYRAYVQIYANLQAINAFGTVDSMLEKKMPTTIRDGEKMFAMPFRRIVGYVDFIQSLIDEGMSDESANKDHMNALIEKRTLWEALKLEKDTALELALRTAKFWESGGKNLVQKLQSPERRLILDSKEIPIKIHTSNYRFSSHWFLLFSDVFCHHSGSQQTVHPLSAIWITNKYANTEIDSRKCSFNLITPEEQLILLMQDNEVKQKWLNAIEYHIKMCLDEPLTAEVPDIRTANYTFSEKYTKYPSAKYFGRWYRGKMWGIGHLEFVDGKVFDGEMNDNEIKGFGRMFTPTVGIYEGYFVAGKYHGYGVLENRNGGMYEGNFRDGLHHGHGILRTDRFTYIGEFVNNQKNGYGVLDDGTTGDKYMGMFVDGKKCGFGILITMDGQYFEGIFANDLLAGEGVAVFENGSYYEGDLTCVGPSGRGSMFLPTDEVVSETIELEDRKILMTGTIMTGTMGGSWNDIRINHGNVTMNEIFAKFPRSLGLLATDHNRKWRSLFVDWEKDVFNGVVPCDQRAIIWGKVSNFKDKLRYSERLKSESFSDKYRRQNMSDDDRISIKSNRSSRRSSVVVVKEFNTKIQEFIVEANNFNRPAAKPLSSQKFAGGVLYDNLKNGANLLEMFKAKKDVAAEILLSSAKESDENQNDKTYSPTFHDKMPDFGLTKLDQTELSSIKQYLSHAFKDAQHPFGVLNGKISYCFYTSYGCWKVKPTSILSSQAMKEWEMISKRIYEFVRIIFPALPIESGDCEGEMISHRSLLYPILLSEGVYSTLFVLYASKCSKNDELYRQRTIACDKKSDENLAAFLRIDRKLWPLIKSIQFVNAINCLKQVKEKYCPREMLNKIENTFKLIDDAKCEVLGDSFMLNADCMMPLTIYLILRASIPHLGAEILLIEDLMGADFEPFMLGFVGYCFTTIKATYQHILSDKFFQE